MHAWNGWYHVDGHTYGTWLPGNPRGWREKDHKKHVPGDYKNPPPAGSGEGLIEHSRRVMRQGPVHLNPAQRRIVGQALAEMMARLRNEPIAVSMDCVHYHILARFHDGDVRPQVGRAKKHAWHLLREAGFSGRLWQRLCHCEPIRDRQHQVNTFDYICRHAEEDAWVWTFREGLYWLKDPPPLR
jgi:hypothetical protein